jgi:hypothetical protein
VVEKKKAPIVDPQERHMTFFKELLSKPFAQSFEVSQRYQTTTPFEKYSAQTRAWKESHGRRIRNARTTDIRTHFVQILGRGLGHIAANPSIKANRQALEESYAFPNEVNREQFSHLGLSEDVLVVNSDKTTAKHFFVNSLGDAAASAAQIFLNKLMGSLEADNSTDAVMRDDKFIMIGERGIGKTFLLNYLLSIHTKELHERRTIVVRLDLTKNVPSSLSIEEWVQWKICKILFVYYDSSSFNRDAVHDVNDSAFEHFIEKERLNMLFDLRSSQTLFEIARATDTQLGETEFEKKYRMEATSFRSPTNTTPRKIETPWFFSMIWDFLVKIQNCKFVVIFDGLDQLGLTKNDRKRYQHLVNDVNAYLSGEKSLWAATLLTMRPKTFRDQINDNNFRHGFTYVLVSQTSPSEIVLRREGYIKNPSYFSHLYTTVKTLGNSYPTTILGFSRAYIKFAMQSLTRSISPEKLRHSSDEEIVDLGFTIVEQIFGENRRKKFQALSDVAAFFAAALPEKFENAINDAENIIQYFEGVEAGITFEIEDPYREISKYHYLFIEALMLESPKQGFRREKYIYSIAADGEISANSPTNFPLKHYVHNIYHYARNPTREIISHALLGIRILQCTKNLKAFDFSELAQFLCDAFGYDVKIINQKFEEMLEDGLLKPYITEEYIVENSYVCAYSGFYMLEALSHSLEYICLALQTVPLPVGAVGLGAFPIRHHSSAEFVVFNKLLSSLNFCRYLKMVEEMESKSFEAYRRALKNSSQMHSFSNLADFKHFEITSKISDEVAKSAIRIIAHAHSSRIEHQISNLDTITSSGGVERYN